MSEATSVGELARRPSAPATVTSRAAGPRSNLSVRQRCLWSAGDPEDNRVHAVYEVDGAVDEAVLSDALASVVRRQEALRTYFRELDGKAMRLVTRRLTVPVGSTDLTAVAPDDREAELDRLLRAEKRHPLPAGSAPLLRVMLFRLAAERGVLSIVLHRLIADEFSPGILLDELASAAAARPSAEDHLARFGDLVTEQRRWLATDECATQLATGTAELAGARALRLAAGQPSEKDCRIELPAALVAEVVSATGVSPAGVLLAAVAVVLSRMSGQDDICVGVLGSGRGTAGTARLIGPLATVLPTRIRLADDQPVSYAFERAETAYRAALARERVPVERLAAELDVAPGDLVDFAVLFTDRDGPVGLAGARRRLLGAGSRKPLLHCVFGTDTVTVRLAHAGRVPAPDLLLDRLAALLRNTAAVVDQPLAELGGPLPPRELALLDRWAAGPGEPDGPTVTELIETSARRRPDAVAVVFGDDRLTYRQLDERANRLAHVLRSRGAGPESRVAVCLPRGLDLVVTLFAVLKAGAAYVPIDPAYPAGRLAFLIGDSGARHVVTVADLVGRTAALPRRTIVLDRDTELIDAAPSGDPRVPAHPDALAYVLYTSGSTGLPKGVGVTNRGLANYVSWATEAYRVADGAGSPLHSSIAFDLTVTSLFPALVAGRTVHLTEEESARVGALAAVVREGGHSLVKLTPAHLELLGGSLDPGELAGATGRLVVGGEALTGEALRSWADRAPDTVVVNEYGPTETVVGCCVHEVAAGEAPAGSVPIGRPIRNTRLYVLDEAGRRVPAGAPGELYIGGTGVARGYLGRPGVTAERFVPDPFGTEPGARLYRTGDIVRYRSDGALEYLGRTDHQVKIRGHRVELGEIEASLLRHRDVRAVAVLAREDRPGDRRLVAYVVARRAPAPEPAALEEFLGRTLPAHMIPAHYLELPELPLTHNGKVDRAALPAPGAARPAPAVVPDGEPALARDTVVEPDLTPVGLPLADVHRPRHILLTGATGYLGAFLLEELLRTGDATVHCLVRADTERGGLARLVNTMRGYGIWDESYRGRIVVVPGCLDRPAVGLSPERFDRLARLVDVIYHCGATVNFVYPYSALRAANVLGTKEILRLACRHRAKAVHYMSTVDIFMHGADRRIDEDSVIGPAEVVGGYDQSKWVAEQLVATLGERGLPVVRYRPWTMLGHSRTGAANPADYSCVLLKGCIQLGVGPDHDLSMNLMPVDFVSRAVVHVSRQRDSFGRAFHFRNPSPVSLRQVWKWVSDFGYRFDIVSDEQWRRVLGTVGPDNALYPVVPLLLRDDFVDPRGATETAAPVIGTANTDAALSGSGIECPPMSAELGEKILSHLVRTGFIDSPGSRT